MKKQQNQKFALKLNKKVVANIKGGATSAGANARAAASGAAKNTCQWSCPGNCVSNTCTVS